MPMVWSASSDMHALSPEQLIMPTTVSGDMVVVPGSSSSSRSFFSWISSLVKETLPQDVRLFLGTEKEKEILVQRMVATGMLERLDATKRPNSFLALSTQDDVARVEDRTFICSSKKEDAGPTNNWVDPIEMKDRLKKLFKGCMQGRTMYIVPFCMGPLGSKYAKYGIEITDSPYVALSLSIMTRVSAEVFSSCLESGYVPCVHSVGAPLRDGQEDVAWPCNTRELVVAHFPDSMEAWSYGSGYGGNALLNKKAFALRLASVMARGEGWLAEHMLIIGVTNPKGVKKYFAASFPSACGKTNLAMLTSPIQGWKVECVGDDIAWMCISPETGELRAINPEFGFFGVAPGTSEKTNPNAMQAVAKNSIFTNVGKTAEGDVWWEGIGYPPPSPVTTWLKEPYVEGKNLAAHPNSRFTTPLSQCPSLDSDWNSPQGVPISAIIFGGRRKTTIPLVREAISWAQGVLYGASMTSETTAAAKGEVGKIRHDPFAMLPFCGYNMADYFAHWLDMGKKLEETAAAPKIYYVNWFLQGDQGEYLWPGFSANMYVVKWMFERLEGLCEDAHTTPIGIVPNLETVEMPKGVVMPPLFHIDKAAWIRELEETRRYFSLFSKEKFPEALEEERQKQLSALAEM